MPLPCIDPARYEDQLAAKLARYRSDFAEFDLPEPAVFRSAPLHYRLRAEFRLWHHEGRIDYAMFDSADPKQPILLETFPAAAEPIAKLMPRLRDALQASEALRRKIFQVDFLATLSGECLVSLVYHRPLDAAGAVAARALAEALDLDLRVVETTADALASRLPRAVRLTATPLYNLHPVSRVLACEAALAIGADALLTGDGADQVAARAAAAPDYVPIVEAIVRGSGLRLAAPFLDDEVGAALVSKEQLRALARTWGVPASHAHAPKRPAWAPPLPRAHFPADDIVANLARALDLPLGWSDDDRTNVGIASLAALVAAFDVGSV